MVPTPVSAFRRRRPPEPGRRIDSPRMSPAPDVTVVIPIHNESGYLPEAVPRLLDDLATVSARIEVILAENGSTDATARIATDLAAADERLRVLSLPEPDYGAAMRAGFLAATGSWVVTSTSTTSPRGSSGKAWRCRRAPT